MKHLMKRNETNHDIVDEELDDFSLVNSVDERA